MNFAVTPVSVTCTLSAWMPIGRFLVRVEVKASSAGCTVSRGSVKPSPVSSTTCSVRPPSETCGLARTVPMAPLISMVPSEGLVFTPLTRPPRNGMASCTVCLMPSLDQVMLASSAPMVPAESAVLFSWMSSSNRLSFMPLASRIWLPAVSTEMLS